jgi:hypothetical protein
VRGRHAARLRPHCPWRAQTAAKGEHVCARVCVCVCVRACVRACVRVCVCVCVCGLLCWRLGAPLSSRRLRLLCGGRCCTCVWMDAGCRGLHSPNGCSGVCTSLAGVAFSHTARNPLHGCIHTYIHTYIHVTPVLRKACLSAVARGMLSSILSREGESLHDMSCGWPRHIFDGLVRRHCACCRRRPGFYSAQVGCVRAQTSVRAATTCAERVPVPALCGCGVRSLPSGHSHSVFVACSACACARLATDPRKTCVPWHLCWRMSIQHGRGCVSMDARAGRDEVAPAAYVWRQAGTPTVGVTCHTAALLS